MTGSIVQLGASLHVLNKGGTCYLEPGSLVFVPVPMIVLFLLVLLRGRSAWASFSGSYFIYGDKLHVAEN